jgi:MscS family membrane protein
MPVLALVAVLALLVTSSARAQGLLKLPPAAKPAPNGDSTARTPGAARAEPYAPDSPRASVIAFLDLARRGQYGAAAQYLDLPDTLRGRGADVARQLRAVLERRIWIDPEAISGASLGDTTAGLPRGVQRVGQIEGRDGRQETLWLVRAIRGGEPRWVFSRNTVLRTPAWYDALGDRWAFENLPPVLLRVGPLGLTWWQWLALPFFVALSWLIGTLVSRVGRATLTRAARRTDTEWDDAILAQIGAPLTLALALAAAAVLLPLLALDLRAQVMAGRVLRAGFFLVFFWSLWRFVDVARQVSAHSRWAAQGPAASAVLVLAARIAKVAVAAMAAVAVLSTLGFPVASLVAGLGIGGLALALAAQKTVENLFGAFSIGVDQPFRVGDYVKVDEFAGTVETIGLRSTRIRTLDRTLVTMPNGKLADSRVESFAARDRIRLAATIRLVLGTTSAQLRQVLSEIEGVLRAHPLIWPDTVVVRLIEIATSSLDIEVQAWFLTTDFNEFRLIRQEMLLQFIEVVERSGTHFALPARTVHVIAPDGATAPRAVLAPAADVGRPGGS